MILCSARNNAVSSTVTTVHTVNAAGGVKVQVGGTQVSIATSPGLTQPTRTNQQPFAVAIGQFAGWTSQGAYSVSVGTSAGFANTSPYQVNVGRSANEIANDTTYSVSLGDTSNRGPGTRPRNVAIGSQNTSTSTTLNSVGTVGIGGTGNVGAGDYTVAIGASAHRFHTGGARKVALGGNGSQVRSTIVYDDAIAMGTGAGGSNQNTRAIAVGYNAGFFNQGFNSIALGSNAGTLQLGAHSIVVGTPASNTVSVGANTIVLQANGGAGLATLNNSVRVADVRRVDSGTGKVSAIAGWFPVVRLNDELVYSTN